MICRACLKDDSECGCGEVMRLRARLQKVEEEKEKLLEAAEFFKSRSFPELYKKIEENSERLYAAAKERDTLREGLRLAEEWLGCAGPWYGDGKKNYEMLPDGPEIKARESFREWVSKNLLLGAPSSAK
jgi:hypothetical protein